MKPKNSTQWWASAVHPTVMLHVAVLPPSYNISLWHRMRSAAQSTCISATQQSIKCTARGKMRVAAAREKQRARCSKRKQREVQREAQQQKGRSGVSPTSRQAHQQSYSSRGKAVRGIMSGFGSRGFCCADHSYQCSPTRHQVLGKRQGGRCSRERDAARKTHRERRGSKRGIAREAQPREVNK